MLENTHTNITNENTYKRTEALWVCFVSIMVGVAYYPTLLGDYVPQDQWRAFKYSLEPGLPGDRLGACFSQTSKFYFLTGRWLVWIGECVEHAAVEQISDFMPLRVFVLLIVILSAILFRRVLKNIFDSSPVATVLAVMVVLLPGYAFMYYQGLTGTPVLLALAFSLLSFSFISHALTAEERGRKLYINLLTGGLFFIAACFIYPIFAFAVIPMAFIFSAFRAESLFGKRVYLCIKLCFFYAFVALTYYLTVKSGIAIAEYLGKSIPDLKSYQMEINTNPSDLAVRLNIISREITVMAMANVSHLPMWLSIIIFLAPSGIIYFEGQRLGWGLSGSIIAATTYSIGVPIIALASMAPWFFSHFPGVAYRHILPVHFFLILSFGILLARGIETVKRLFSKNAGRRIELMVMLAIIALFSINQIPLSQHQVADSTIEINHMRAAYREMVANGRFWELKEIHIIRPKIGRDFTGHRIDREFAPATMANPEHILQMTHAVLRETLSPAEQKRVHLMDCRFDRNCAISAPQNALVISQSKFGTPLPDIRKNHAIIDFSQLNKAP